MIFGRRLTGLLGHQTASLSHLEKIQIDSKLVSSEKASQVTNAAKDGFGIRSRGEVIS